LMKEKKLTPELKDLISYEPDTRLSSLGTLLDAEDTSWIPGTSDMTDKETLREEIREIMSLDVYQKVMKSRIEKILNNSEKENETARMEVAKAIGLMKPDSPLVGYLERFLEDESLDVCRYAIESAARLKAKEYIPALVQKLQDPVIKRDACTALEKYGPKIIGTLADFLGDQDEPVNSRKELASIIARIGTQEAVDFLTWELMNDDESIETELVDALDQIRTLNPEIEFQENIVRKKIASNIRKHYMMTINIHDALKKGEKVGPELSRNLSLSLMNIFKLLGLIFPHDEITRAYQNIKAGTKDSVAYAVELLDNLLDRNMKEAFFPVVEDFSLEERVRIFRNILKNFPEL